MKKKYFNVKTLILGTVLAMSFAGNAFAKESDFSDGVYRYTGTGYTTGKSGSNELVCKIDKYYYENLSDTKYCAVDDYFYKRNSSGKVIDKNCYGYAVAQFEKKSNGKTTVKGSSERQYGYGNKVAYSDGVSTFSSYTSHYYGTTLR